MSFQSYSLPRTLEDLRDSNFGVWLWGPGWCGGNRGPLSRAASGHYLWGPPHLQPPPGLGVLGSLAPSDPTPFCPRVSVPRGAYPSQFPSLQGGAPWPREKDLGLCELSGRVRARGSRVRLGLGPFDAWAGVGARARIKRPQSCPQPAPSASVAGAACSPSPTSPEGWQEPL